MSAGIAAAHVRSCLATLIAGRAAPATAPARQRRQPSPAPAPAALPAPHRSSTPQHRPARASQGYKAAKQLDTALENIKWVTDYFIKCVGDGTEIVGQVGNGNQDHGERRLGVDGGGRLARKTLRQVRSAVVSRSAVQYHSAAMASQEPAALPNRRPFPPLPRPFH